MSKKLIAVAAAAALALTGLVVMPTAATATGPFAVTVEGTTSTATASRDGSVATKALQVNVPSQDVIRLVATHNTNATGNSTAIKFNVTTPGATDAVTVTATGGVELLTTTQFDPENSPTTATGTQSLTVAAAAGVAAFYGYTTSTTAGTVVISAAGSSKTYFVAGLSTAAYKLELTGPATASLGSEFTISGKVKDMFGNDLTTALDITNGFSNSPVGATAVTTATKTKYDTATKTYSFVWTAPTTATGTAVQIALAPAARPASVTAFGAPVVSQFFTVNAVDLTAQVTALTAQVAALQAQLDASRLKANSVTKKRWNKLVRAHRALGGTAKLK